VKRLSPAATLALEEALAVIFHYKDDLRRFLEVALQNAPLVSRYAWGDSSLYKRQIVRDLIRRLTADQNRYLAQLTQLCLAVVDMRDFSHLTHLENGAQKAKTAKAAVDKLRALVEPHKEARDEEAEARERQRRATLRLQQNSAIREKLATINTEFFQLATGTDAQGRGYQLEKILRETFELFDLDPKASFKLVGEQIDGAFAFQGTDYLLEARWTHAVQNAEALNGFDGKVRRKLDNTLGLFLSINGYSPDGITAFGSGERPRIILMDGADLAAVLDQRIELGALILRKKQHASRTGQIFLPYQQMGC